jgi:molybdate transport system regulatory protein
MRPAKFNLNAELTVRVGDELLANSKRIALLRQIDEIENLTKAAKLAGYSYTGAWDSIQQMSELSGGTLLERHAGGKGGGRTKLTERGKQLLKKSSTNNSKINMFYNKNMSHT